MGEKIIIAEVITDLQNHGAEIMLYNLLSKIDRNNFYPVVFTLVNGSLNDKILSLGIPVYSMNLSRGQIPNIKLLRSFIQKIKRINPDIIHSWMYHGNIISLLLWLSVRKKPQLFWAIHNSIYSLKEEKFLTAVLIVLGAFLSKLPKSILYVSKLSAIQHERIKYRKDKTVIIPNGFDTELFAPNTDARENLRIELGLRQNSVLIGLIGRYEPKKDHENFLVAASLLLNDYREIHFIMAGKGINWKNKKLRNKIHKLKIKDSVHLLGHRNDIHKVSAALDIGCLSSYSEAFPMTIGELMSCGVPCIATDVGDSSKIIGDCGLLVPPIDSISLMKAMKKLVDIGADGRAMLGKSARQRIIEKFSLKNIVNKFEMIYTSHL